MQLKDITKNAVVISESATLADAIRTMTTGKTNTLLVTDDDGVLTGVVSVSDLFDGIVPPSVSGDVAIDLLSDEASFATAVTRAADEPVFSFMSSDFDTVHVDGNIMEVAAIAIAHGQARVPVVDQDNHPIGIISRHGLKQILETYLGKRA